MRTSWGHSSTCKLASSRRSRYLSHVCRKQREGGAKNHGVANVQSDKYTGTNGISALVEWSAKMIRSVGSNALTSVIARTKSSNHPPTSPISSFPMITPSRLSKRLFNSMD